MKSGSMESVVNGVRGELMVGNLCGLERFEILLRGVNTDREMINMDG